jgi:hypothetical protein
VRRSELHADGPPGTTSDSSAASRLSGGQAFGYALGALGLVRVFCPGRSGRRCVDDVHRLVYQPGGQCHSARAKPAQQLPRVYVGQVMDAQPPVVEAGSSLQQLVFEQLPRTGRRWVVVARDGRPLGLSDAATVSRVPRDLWPATPVEQAMRPIGLSVAPDVEVAELLDRLDEATSTAPVPVVAAGCSALSAYRRRCALRQSQALRRIVSVTCSMSDRRGNTWPIQSRATLRVADRSVSDRTDA